MTVPARQTANVANWAATDLGTHACRPLESRCRDARWDTGDAHHYRGKVRHHHGHHAQARDDFQVAVGHFTSFLEYVEREMPAEEGDAECSVPCPRLCVGMRGTECGQQEGESACRKYPAETCPRKAVSMAPGAFPIVPF
jgi:hypothetical protein